jgi:hypothetical protein
MAAAIFGDALDWERSSILTSVKYDEMVDQLSMARALGELKDLRGTPIWEVSLQGSQARATRETALVDALAPEGYGRERVVTRWT